MYKLDIEDVLINLNTKKSGLTFDEVKKRDNHKNIINSKETESIIIMFLKQFTDLLVIILILSSIISILIHDYESAIVIISVIILNAVIGFIENYKVNRSVDHLKKLISRKTIVIRDGTKQEIKTEDVVVGDVVYIESGNLVPADLRLFEVNNLKIQEASLTGEAEPVEKCIEKIKDSSVLQERYNMAFSGTKVVLGNGLGITTKIGMDTEIGHIATLLNKTKSEKTPLEIKMNKFSQFLACIVLLISLVVFMININNGKEVFDALIFALALAVAAIPEALGSIVNIAIAIGTERLAKKNVIVKDVKSLQVLGLVSLICTDKTGTITKNEMYLKTYFDKEFIEVPRKDDFAICSLICNNAFVENDKYIGDSTDIAFLRFFKDIKIEYQKISEIPFDSNRKMMTVKAIINNKTITFHKGAFEVIIKKCYYYLDDKTKINKGLYFQLKRINDSKAKEGFRTLALAKEENEKIIFLGIAFIMDPAKDKIDESIKRCYDSYIDIKMLTGDQSFTAEYIAKEIGLRNVSVIQHDDFLNLNEVELMKCIKMNNVFARITPEDKLMIVSKCQKQKEVVAMIGDGVNDAPALKKADIGIAMGKEGTSVSHEAASIVLLDDDFSTIISSIKSGRSVYANITNAIAFLISGNIAGIIVVLYVMFKCQEMPFTPEQLLFINLLTDSIPAIAITLTSENESQLNYKPRKKDANIINRHLWKRVILEGILISIATIFAYVEGLKEDHLTAMTLSFSTLCLARLYHGFNSTTKGSILRYGIENKYIVLSYLLGVILLNVVLFTDFFMKLFDIVELSLENIITLNVLAIFPTFFIQIYKFVKEGLKNG